MVVVSGALLVSPSSQSYRWMPLTCRIIGGRRAEADELHTDLPTSTQRRGKLFRLQRCLPSRLPSGLEAPIDGTLVNSVGLDI
jgi:hypothetical protein